MSSTSSNVLGWVRPNGVTNAEVYFKAGPSAPFIGFNRSVAPDEATASASTALASYVRFENLSGSSLTVDCGVLTPAGKNVHQQAGIHGVQIIDRTADGDSDGATDLNEGLAGTNPGTHDAAADPDTDGLTNGQEASAGTDAKDTDGTPPGSMINLPKFISNGYPKWKKSRLISSGRS